MPTLRHPAPLQPRIRVCFAAVFAILGAFGSAPAAVDFVRDVRPVLEKHCFTCHGTEKQKGGLRLDVKSAAFKGGEDHGPSIVPGNPSASPLVNAVRSEGDLKMPPKGERLSAVEAQMLARWVEEGARWPDGVDTVQVADPRNHWAFRQPTHPEVPQPKNPTWARDAMDRFILHRLEREGLEPAPAADRAAWLRRVTYGVTGLPPTPEQRLAFESDARPDAYERVVDTLLASPRYGEHWAQHWLDLVRYADTHGFEVNTERPNAWPYRDYVIRAFNSDTPYPQFVREQIAGDALGQDAATGFLVTASVLLPGQIGKDDASKRLARQDSLDEIVVNVGQTFLGVSIGCARCHHHKFDPISSKDYYAMQSFFAGVTYEDREMQTPEATAAREKARALRTQLAELEKNLGALVPMALAGVARPVVNARKNVDRFPPVRTRRLRFSIEATNQLEPCLDELEVLNTDGVNVALAKAGAQVTASGQRFEAGRHELRFVNDGQFGNSSSWMSDQPGKGWVLLAFAQEHALERVIWSRDREGKLRDRLATRYAIEVETGDGGWQRVADSSDRTRPLPENPTNKPETFDPSGLSASDSEKGRAFFAQKQKIGAELKAIENATKVFAGGFRSPDAIHILHRGDPEQPKEPVTPAVPEKLGALRLEADTGEQERRRALAEWLVAADNPLVARVIVNRIWQWHFGTGLVDTPSDFGLMGSRPTHPELLDWLADEFVREGWSFKQLHRRILLSATYRQSSRFLPGAAAKDSDARLLWRFPPRRLEAENIRDSLLAVCGRLNTEMYGRGFNLFQQRGGLAGFVPVEALGPENSKRMIYAHKVRREPDAVFGAFDCPDAGLSTSRRRESMTPIQALNLLNSRFTLEVSQHFAERVLREAGPDPQNQIQRAYALALCRDATAEEVADALPEVQTQGAVVLCRALFNSNEFLFLP
jgi:hypothetical protein